MLLIKLSGYGKPAAISLGAMLSISRLSISVKLTFTATIFYSLDPPDWENMISLCQHQASTNWEAGQFFLEANCSIFVTDSRFFSKFSPGKRSVKRR
jgi:hypothetical protein